MIESKKKEERNHSAKI